MRARSGGAGPVRVNGAEPQNGLVPCDTVEGHGSRIVDQLFTGLYRYDADGELRPAMLDTLRTDDHRHYTITLRAGWTFTDGTPVTAHSYVDAWNHAALSTHRQAQRGFFAAVEGYADVAADPPRARTLTGLAVRDDLTFTVTLGRPDHDFPRSLGCLPARPLPRVFFERGAEAFGENPVGNGPYMMAGEGAWRHHDGVDLVPNPAYRGPDAPRNEGISFVFYDRLTDAYADLLAGRLDVLDSVPDSVLPTYHQDLGPRAVSRPIALNNHLAVPLDLPHFGGAEGALRRAAISRAVDRARITEGVLHSTRSPAADFTARALPGSGRPLPGAEVLTHDPDAARALWAEADALSAWEGVFRIAYNESGGYDLWIDAVAEQLRDVLGIEVATVRHPTFKSIRDRIADGTLRSAFRTGWRGDYPSPVNFLAPLFCAGAPANEVGYRSAEFEAEMAGAKAAASLEEADAHVRRAQSVLLRDLPVIPLWDYVHAGGRGEDVSVTFTWNGMPDYPGIEKQAQK
ncbi:peptide ABC transporter substrate-binding protein [Streptomyces sp. NPDC054975]